MLRTPRRIVPRALAAGTVLCALGLALASCARASPGPRLGDRPQAAPPVADPVVLLARSRCQVLVESPRDEARPQVIAFTKWGVDFLVVTPPNGDAQVAHHFILDRLVPGHTLPALKGTPVAARASLDERTGKLWVATNEDRTLEAAKTELSGSFTTGAVAALGRERILYMPGAVWLTKEVVLVVDHRGDFFERYERMHACAEKAMKGAKELL